MRFVFDIPCKTVLSMKLFQNIMSMIPCLSMRYQSHTHTLWGPSDVTRVRIDSRQRPVALKQLIQGKPQSDLPPPQTKHRHSLTGWRLIGWCIWKKQHGPKNVSFMALYFWRAVVVVDSDTQWLNNIDFTLRSEGFKGEAHTEYTSVITSRS